MRNARRTFEFGWTFELAATFKRWRSKKSSRMRGIRTPKKKFIERNSENFATCTSIVNCKIFTHRPFYQSDSSIRATLDRRNGFLEFLWVHLSVWTEERRSDWPASTPPAWNSVCQPDRPFMGFFMKLFKSPAARLPERGRTWCSFPSSSEFLLFVFGVCKKRSFFILKFRCEFVHPRSGGSLCSQCSQWEPMREASERTNEKLSLRVSMKKSMREVEWRRQRKEVCLSIEKLKLGI